MHEHVPAPPWVRFLNLEHLLQTHPPHLIEAALRHRHAHAGPPAVVGPNLVFTLRPAAADGVYCRPLARAPLLTVILTSPGETLQDLRARCSCGHTPSCEHVLAVQADLAIHAALREALVRGEPVTEHLAELQQLRRHAYADFTAHRALRDWAPRDKPAAPSAPVYSITVIDTVGDAAVAPGLLPAPSQHPLLEVRPRVADTRATLTDDDRKRLRFAPLDAQILRLLSPISSYKKGFQATGAAAAGVVHLLQRRPVLDETTGLPVRFVEAPLVLRLDPVRMPRHRVGRRGAAGGDEAPRPTLAARARVRVAAPPTDPVLLEEVSVLAARWLSQDGAVSVPSAEAILFVGLHPRVYVPALRTFFPVSSGLDVEVAWRLFLRPHIELPAGHGPTLYRRLRAALYGSQVLFPAPAQMGLAVAEQPQLLVRIEGEPLAARLTLLACYSHGEIPLRPGPPSVEVSVNRDLEVEVAALHRVMRLELTPGFCASDGTFHVDGDSAVWLWTHGLDALRGVSDPPLGVLLDETLAHTRVRGALVPHLRVALEGSYFITQLRVHAEDADEVEVDHFRLRAALHAGQRWLTLGDGTLAELSAPLRGLLQDCPALLDGDEVRLALHQAGRLSRFLGTQADEASPGESPLPRCHVELSSAAAALLHRLQQRLSDGTGGLCPVPAQVPAGLQATLRDYQLLGLSWLQFLHELGAGGILADDMGLGKTVMTLALLLWQKQQRPADAPPGPPSLVVCPTSVTEIWLREAARFTPSLRVGLWTPPRPSSDAPADEAAGSEAPLDLLVATYGSLRRRSAELSAGSYEYVILDEAQNIKNAGTAAATVARGLRSRRRLALSGTPIENHLAELWSLCEFTNPGMLGTQLRFLREFEQPIQAESRGVVARRLRALVRPFILRRTKRQVLRELPPKEEIEIRCLMTEEHRRRYDQLAGVLRRDFEEQVGQRGQQSSALLALLRLRQMAIDPALLDPQFPRGCCAKRQMFLDLVSNLLSAGRRALVFSQFVNLLTLWRGELDRLGVAYEYLDGRTRMEDRAAVVERFQRGDASLFLISLRAGGTGLNLTAADTVIHCDPWWNPAVEDQATDRAHRLGQERQVTVYRLVAAGTVEDRVLQLRQRKRELSDAVIDDGAGALRGLSVDDVRYLLSAAEGPLAEPLDEAEDPPPEAELTEGRCEAPGADSAQPLRAASLLEQSSPELLAEIGARMAQWLRGPGRRPRDLARLLSLTTTDVTRLIKGKHPGMPTQRAERVRLFLLEQGEGSQSGAGMMPGGGV